MTEPNFDELVCEVANLVNKQLKKKDNTVAEVKKGSVYEGLDFTVMYADPISFEHKVSWFEKSLLHLKSDIERNEL